MKRALILGIGGQDGSYLAELLLERDYEVHGLIRRSATGNTRNIESFRDRLHLHYGDLTDPISVYSVLDFVRPAEVYNEADQDHAGISFKIPAYNFDITGTAVGRILESIRLIDKNIKFFQPLTSNMFGKSEVSPQNEQTPFNPQSPYACAKVFAWSLCQMYRKVYDMHVCTGILYNHESPRRTEEYVTRKITRSLARIRAGLQERLVLGDLNAQIDWGYSKEFMEAAWKIMQLDQPDEFVIGTGESHTVREFLDEACRVAELDPEKYVSRSDTLMRPGSNSVLVADTRKAQRVFGFNPRIKFKQLVELMVKHDIEDVQRKGVKP